MTAERFYLIRHAVLALALVLTQALSWAAPARANNTDLTELMAHMRLDEVLEIMAEEGQAYSKVIAADMFPGGNGGDMWVREVARIYDTNTMRATMSVGFGDGLAPETYKTILAFYDTALGARLTELELSARRALLDEEVEQAAIEAYREKLESENPELDRLTGFIEANDLVDANVVGGMNSNVAFYRGLVDGGAFPFEMTDEQILSDVWAQEEDIRAETLEWVYSYLSMAFHPLSDEDLDAYVAFSSTEEGRILNRLLFDAFDLMFTDISYKLGRAAGQVLSGQDI